MVILTKKFYPRIKFEFNITKYFIFLEKKKRKKLKKKKIRKKRGMGLEN